MSITQIEQELKSINHDSVFAECIRSNPKEAIPMIVSQIKDNRVLVCEIIGTDLVTVIEQL